jgi:hypothetical protein
MRPARCAPTVDRPSCVLLDIQHYGTLAAEALSAYGSRRSCIARRSGLFSEALGFVFVLATLSCLADLLTASLHPNLELQIKPFQIVVAPHVGKIWMVLYLPAKGEVRTPGPARARGRRAPAMPRRQVGVRSGRAAAARRGDPPSPATHHRPARSRELAARAPAPNRGGRGPDSDRRPKSGSANVPRQIRSKASSVPPHWIKGVVGPEHAPWAEHRAADANDRAGEAGEWSGLVDGLEG